MAQAAGARGHRAPGLKDIFLTPALGFWPCFLGHSVNLFSARHLLWEQGLMTCGFGAHFPCPQAQWEPGTLLPSPALGQ